ncbi:Plasmodium exported protein (PHIST), unknown, putative [Plasmodium sp. gorilla clade G1]|nr:Plasmodium exported protein (PHIST), unknown, putative [Plasmodium sp. gorilla clade G1]
MTNKQNCSSFPCYTDEENIKGKLHFISFTFLCLIFYMIGFFYIFLNISLEKRSLEFVQIGNVYKRSLSEVEIYNKEPEMKRNLKHKKGDLNKSKHNINKIKYNEQSVEKYKNIINKNLWNINMEDENNSYIKNVDYNDMSKNLTEKELRDVLDSLKECPSEEDLKNIWNHTIGVAKEGFDNVMNMLKGLIQKYLDNDIYLDTDKYGKCFLYDSIWKQCRTGFCQTVATEVLEYTNKFFNLINDKHTLDDILKFIYSFLEHFTTLKKVLHEKYHKELLDKIEQTFPSFQDIIITKSKNKKYIF